MDTILVKIFATALTLSQVTTDPQSVKTSSIPPRIRTQVVQILRNGCAHMKQAFDIESINLDDLIATALDDPKAVGADIKAFHGLNFTDLNTAYHQFCKNERSPARLSTSAMSSIFITALWPICRTRIRSKARSYPSLSVVLDGGGDHFADVFDPGNRRSGTPLSDIPDFVQKAFVAAEDRRFFQHHGVDEHGIIRAFIGNLAEPGRPQGGSTITQQVVKNLLVGDDVTYERKIREMIVASRLENTLSKNDILELYINSAYLGRSSWGVEMASRSYFGKSAKDLTLSRSRDAGRACSRVRTFTIPTAIPIAPRNVSPMCSAACRMMASSARRKRTRRLRRRRSSSPICTRIAIRVPFRRLSRPRGKGRRRR